MVGIAVQNFSAWCFVLMGILAYLQRRGKGEAEKFGAFLNRIYFSLSFAFKYATIIYRRTGELK